MSPRILHIGQTFVAITSSEPREQRLHPADVGQREPAFAILAVLRDQFARIGRTMWHAVAVVQKTKQLHVLVIVTFLVIVVFDVM